jgi:signal transduction histidine kinase
LREQFVAILAHDLRNPLASIDAGVNVILRRNPDEKTRSIGEQVHKSALRMASLIDDMLDFARGRLGGGFMLERNPNAPLYDHLEQVIGELCAIYLKIPLRRESIWLIRSTATRTRRSNHFEPCRERDEARRSQPAYPGLGVD